VGSRYLQWLPEARLALTKQPNAGECGFSFLLFVASCVSTQFGFSGNPRRISRGGVEADRSIPIPQARIESKIVDRRGFAHAFPG
jgi:hypothetical protein